MGSGLSQVVQHRAVTQRCVQCSGHKQVGGPCVVVLDRSEDPVVEDPEIKSEVGCSGLLPFEILVRKVIAGKITHVVSVSELTRHRLGHTKGGVVVDPVLVAYYSVTCP